MVKNLTKNLIHYFLMLWLVFSGITYYCAVFNFDITYPIPIIGTSCYIGYFLIGYLIYNHMDLIHVTVRQSVVIIVSMSLLTCLLTGLFTVKQGYHEERFFEYRNTLIAMSAISLFYLILKEKKCYWGGWIQKSIHLISKHSFTIYLIHIVFLDIMKHQFHPKSIHAAIGIPIYFIGIFVSSLLFSILLDLCKNECKLFCQKYLDGKNIAHWSAEGRG